MVSNPNALWEIYIGFLDESMFKNLFAYDLSLVYFQSKNDTLREDAAFDVSRKNKRSPAFFD